MNKNRIKVEDFYKIKSPNSLAMSSNGEFIAYVVKEISKEEDKSFTNIHLMDIKAKKSRQLTFSGKDKAPCFSPDGKTLAFVSSRSGKNQIWILPLEGGEAWNLKTEHSVVGPLTWTPNGENILYSTEVFSHSKEQWTPYPGAPSYDKDRLIALAEKIHKSKEDNKGSDKENQVKVITDFSYRYDGHGYLGDVKKHLFIIPVSTDSSSSSQCQAKQITKGHYDFDGMTVSPDGKYIAVSSRHSAQDPFDEKRDLWLYEVSNGKEHLLYRAPGPSYHPSWSFCGKYIAFSGHDNKENVSTTNNLWILDIANFMDELHSKGGANPLEASDAVNVTGPIDRPFGGEKYWQGDKLVFLLTDRGAKGIYQFDFKTNCSPILTDRNKSISSFVIAKERIAYIASNPNMPEEIYLFDGLEHQQLTHLNSQFIKDISIGCWEETTYSSDDGQDVDGWIVYPSEFDNSKKYPLVLLIHGGPHSFYGPSFMFLAQIFAAEDYVVLYTNPRGSQSYGQDFASCIDKNWGDRDYADVMAGVDMIASRGFIDTDKMFVHGWSYGGYMACWIATQTNRFKAICAGASVTNLLSEYGTSDITMADEHEYGGQPWKDYEHFIKHSPLGHVENVNTPVLLMHGENDYRVSITQSEEFYIALKRLGKEVIMIRYPNEFHGLSRPIHNIDKFERLVSWFNYYRG